MDEKIIIVDDEEIIAHLIEKFLVMSGFWCKAFCSAEDAANFFEKDNAISLAIIDINLREINGRDLAKKFRSQNPKVKIIMSSGDQKELDNIQSHPYVDGILKKPFTLDELHTLLKNLLV